MREQSASGTSIPSRYTTEVVLNSLAKKGFQSKAARFKQDLSDSPGPGAYTAYYNSSVIRESPSIGAKGTGSFASKSRRIPVNRTQPPGPTPLTYNVQSDFSGRKDFSRVGSSGFAQSVAKNSARRRRTCHPAPNQYNTRKVYDKMNAVSACESAFKSSSVRDANPRAVGSNISPTKYEPVLPKTEKSITSFKSTSSRLQPIAITDGPGPAHYSASLDQVTKRTDQIGILPRKHGLLISANAMAIPPEPPLPGPGAYNITKFKEDKKFSSSAVFKSGTSRLQKSQPNFHPGPGEYDPVLQKKTSFNFLVNSNPKWIGV